MYVTLLCFKCYHFSDLFPSVLDDFVIELSTLEGSGAFMVQNSESSQSAIMSADFGHSATDNIASTCKSDASTISSPYPRKAVKPVSQSTENSENPIENSDDSSYDLISVLGGNLHRKMTERPNAENRNESVTCYDVEMSDSIYQREYNHDKIMAVASPVTLNSKEMPASIEGANQHEARQLEKYDSDSREANVNLRTSTSNSNINVSAKSCTLNSTDKASFFQGKSIYNVSPKFVTTSAPSQRSCISFEHEPLVNVAVHPSYYVENLDTQKSSECFETSVVYNNFNSTSSSNLNMFSTSHKTISRSTKTCIEERSKRKIIPEAHRGSSITTRSGRTVKRTNTNDYFYGKYKNKKNIAQKSRETDCCAHESNFRPIVLQKSKDGIIQLKNTMLIGLKPDVDQIRSLLKDGSQSKGTLFTSESEIQKNTTFPTSGSSKSTVARSFSLVKSADNLGGDKLECYYCGDLKSSAVLQSSGQSDQGHHKVCLECHKGFYVRPPIAQKKKTQTKLKEVLISRKKSINRLQISEKPCTEENHSSTLLKLSRSASKEKARSLCSLCNKDFINLNRHIARVHEQATVACDICNVVVKKDCLKSHKNRRHSISSLVECDHCGKSFKSAMSLREHLTRVRSKIRSVLNTMSLDSDYLI